MLGRILFSFFLSQTILHICILFMCFVGSQLLSTDLISIVYPEVIIPSSIGGVIGVIASLVDEKF